MARYNLQEAGEYILKALTSLNSARGLHIVLLDLEYTDLLGGDFIKVHLYDKTTKTKFDSMLNEFIFTREDTMTNLDIKACIKDKNLDTETKIILRVAYTILRDGAEAKNTSAD